MSASGPLVVFDLDGTLVDSSRDLAEAANCLIVENGGVPQSEGDIIGMIGEGVLVLVRRVLRAGCGFEHVGDAEVGRFRELYGERLLQHTVPYPGVPELLDRLSERRPLAVLTNKPAEPARRILTGLGLIERFAAIVGGDGPSGRKPEPAGLLELARRFGDGDAMLVGDSAIDLRTAAAAGLPFAWATWGFGGAGLDADQLRPCDLLLDEPLQLARHLDA